jgi:hypothetical protein
VVEQWLRRAANATVEKEIQDATTAYYQSLRADERAEEERLARALPRPRSVSPVAMRLVRVAGAEAPN